ncbi:MAG: hypothetical protein KC931_27290, partial [Candidatus Omnitrophica bacterium]|nr:hypothetical protein [Candidatus Omnitrophota bacterium]
SKQSEGQEDANAKQCDVFHFSKSPFKSVVWEMPQKEKGWLSRMGGFDLEFPTTQPKGQGLCQPSEREKKGRRFLLSLAG